MADQPGQPDPPEKWRVYEEDTTPDPEASPQAPPPPQVPYGDASPHVPYGQQQGYTPVFVTTSSVAWVPKLVLGVVALVVVAIVAVAALAIVAAVDGGIDSGIDAVSGVDPKSPEDFEEMVADLEDETGSTKVFSVGLYDGYAIIYAPVDDSTRSIGWRWDGGGIEEWTKTTSTDARFDVADIDPSVIEGMCDPVLEAADGATPGDCYVQIRKPTSGDAWFSAGASDEFGQYFSVMYDQSGVEVARYPE